MMKIQATERQVAIHGALEQNEFTIKATPEMFRLLADGLYQDKPTAVLRELSANAVDAHTAAGCPEKPFDVQLPTSVEPTLRIRDYGLGLPHKSVMNLYTAFGYSNKQDTNTQIGGFGVGSKSPLAYTTAFTVISYYNGEKRIYSTFLQENGVPSCSHLGTSPTKESNGLELIVPIKVQDCNTFCSKASNVYRYYKVKPNFLGVVPEDLQVNYFLHKEGDFGVRTSRNTCTYAIMGGLGYKIDCSQIESGLTREQVKVLDNKAFDIFFDVGELSVAASREGLSYTPATIRAIQNRAVEIAGKFPSLVQKEVDKLTTEREATMFYGEMPYEIRSLAQNLTWRTKPLGLHLSLCDPEDAVLCCVENVAKPKLQKISGEIRPQHYTSTVVIIDEPKHQTQRLALLLENLKSEMTAKWCGLLVVKTTEVKKYSKSLTDLGFKVELLSTQPVQKPTRKPSGCLTVRTFTRRNVPNICSEILNLSELSTDKLWAITRDGLPSIAHKDREVNFASITRFNEFLSLISDDLPTEVYLIPAFKVTKAVREHPHMKFVDDVFNANRDALLAKLVKFNRDRLVLTEAIDVMRKLRPLLKLDTSSLPNSQNGAYVKNKIDEINQVFDKVSEYARNNRLDYTAVYDNLERLLPNTKSEAASLANWGLTLDLSVVEQFPMLQYIQNYDVESDAQFKKDLTNYINSVNLN